jgi:virginiamycin B lyase
MPAANLNTGAFDGDGIFWFSGQSGTCGRLDPATGEIRVYLPAPESRYVAGV